jgi:hypothetical protein
MLNVGTTSAPCTSVVTAPLHAAASSFVMTAGHAKA